MFTIDNDRYRIIDISNVVIPGENPDRPFDIRQGRLADDSVKFDVLRTHTHVGTHVECAAHFFDGGKTPESYELGAFFGRGVMVTVDLPATEKNISAAVVKQEVGGIIRSGDIVVFRNRAEPPKESRQYFDPQGKKFLTAEVAQYLRDYQVKMVVFGKNVSMGEGKEAGRRFHEILMGSGALFVESVDNLFEIKRKEFFLMALPILIRGIDSSWCRAIVIEER